MEIQEKGPCWAFFCVVIKHIKLVFLILTVKLLANDHSSSERSSLFIIHGSF